MPLYHIIWKWVTVNASAHCFSFRTSRHHGNIITLNFKCVNRIYIFPFMSWWKSSLIFHGLGSWTEPKQTRSCTHTAVAASFTQLHQNLSDQVGVRKILFSTEAQNTHLEVFDFVSKTLSWRNSEKNLCWNCPGKYSLHFNTSLFETTTLCQL